MSTEKQCDKCNTELEHNQVFGSSTYVCKKCKKEFIQNPTHNECNTVVNKLAACGSVSYFCPKCNKQVSRSTVSMNYDPQ